MFVKAKDLPTLFKAPRTKKEIQQAIRVLCAALDERIPGLTLGDEAKAQTACWIAALGWVLNDTPNLLDGVLHCCRLQAEETNFELPPMGEVN